MFYNNFIAYKHYTNQNDLEYFQHFKDNTPCHTPKVERDKCAFLISDLYRTFFNRHIQEHRDKHTCTFTRYTNSQIHVHD